MNESHHVKDVPLGNNGNQLPPFYGCVATDPELVHRADVCGATVRCGGDTERRASLV
jgi:hypothetical protein